MPFRCRQKGCAKRFSTKTGTVMECSNLGFQVWAIALFLFATNLKGISSMKLHRDLGVTRKTAWFLAHRIRETWQDTSAWFAWLPGFHPFDGPMEADETYVGGKRKNMSHEKRKQLRGRGTVGKVAVAGVKDRRIGKVSARVVQHTDSATLQGFVQHHGTPGATVYTDAALSYHGMTGFEHQAVNHSVGEYVRDGAHTNGIESFWSMLKRGYVGVFHQLSAKHLNRLCGRVCRSPQYPPPGYPGHAAEHSRWHRRKEAPLQGFGGLNSGFGTIISNTNLHSLEGMSP